MPTSPDPVIYKATGQKSVHRRRTARLNLTNNFSLSTYGNTLQLVDALGYKLGSFTWNNFGDSGQAAYGSGYTGNLRFGKDKLGWVHVEGSFNGDTNISRSLIVCILPDGYCPERDLTIPCTKLSGSHASTELLTFSSNGEIKIAALDSNVSYFFSLSPFRPA